MEEYIIVWDDWTAMSLGRHPHIESAMFDAHYVEERTYRLITTRDDAIRICLNISEACEVKVNEPIHAES